MNPLPTSSADLASLPRARQLLQPRALARLLAHDAGVRLLEAGCGPDAGFLDAHIPGAAWLDLAAIEAPPLFNKVPDNALLAVLLCLGIGHDTCVVLYGRSSLAAARAAHLLLYAGVRDVRLLDGGFQAWCAAGLPSAPGPGAVPPARADFGAPFPGCPHYLADRAQAAALPSRADGALVSVRTWAEFTGATSGYSYIAARGDIPGARWGRAGRDGDVNSMSDYQHADGRMRSPAHIAQMWGAHGIHRRQQVVFYCGTGWRASLAFFYAWLMGWERIAVYDGGWYEWSQDPGNPVCCRHAELQRA